MKSKTERALVSSTFLEEIIEKIACGSLDMHDPTRSFADVVQWRGKAWGATGGRSKGNNLGAKSVTVREAAPDALWGKSYNDIQARGDKYHLGGCFDPKGQPKETWVMTGDFPDLILDLGALPALVQQLLIL